MSRKFWLQLIRFFVFSAVAVIFFMYVYAGEDLSEMIGKILSINPVWVVYSMLMAMASHLSRAARWCLAIKPLGYNPAVFRAYLAVLFGYFINSLPVPRLGEFARCWLFSKSEGIPLTISLGAVIAERVLDLIMLFSITALAIALEYSRLIDFLSGLYRLNSAGFVSKLVVVVVLGLGGLLALWLLYRFRSKILRVELFKKMTAMFASVKQGLLSLAKLSNKQLAIYLTHTIFIWVMYYGMAYILVFSMSETKHLPPVSGLTMVAMGGIGMAFPTPAGAGSYHYFMTQALILYSVAESSAKEFALLLHTSQVVMAWLTGSLAFVIAYFLNGKKSAQL